MRPGYWMHTNAMDVFIEVVRIQYQDNKRLKLKVRWWNLGYVGRPYCITYRPDTVTINFRDQFKWLPLTVSQLETIRKQPGFPI